jgi:hypothetical protein
MRNLRFGTNFAIFILFFGLAAFEAIRTQAWLWVAVYAALAALFLWADAKKDQ